MMVRAYYDDSYSRGLYYKLRMMHYYDDEVRGHEKWVVSVENSFGLDGSMEFDNREEAVHMYINIQDELDTREEACSTNSSRTAEWHWFKVWNACARHNVFIIASEKGA